MNYLNQIGKRRLLSKAEEIALARRIQQELRTGKNPTEAVNTLVLHNLKLVISIAKRFRTQHLSLDDLVQEGYWGLRTAALRFDPGRGCRFSTCASPWIKQAIGRAIANQKRDIRIPIHLQEKLRKWAKTASALEANLGRKATEKEIGAKLGWDAERCALITMASTAIVSLNTRAQEGDGELLDTIAAVEQESLFRTECAREAIHRMLASLSPQTKKILEIRFGLSGSEALSMPMAARQLGLEPRTVLNTEKRALRALRKTFKEERAMLQI